MKYQRVKDSLGHICRACLNEKFSIQLQPEDCVYTMYPSVCYRCGEVKNIVENISFSKRMMIRFKPYRG